MFATVGYNAAVLSSWSPDIQHSADVRVDAALIARIVAHDSGAVGELYDRHSGLLYGLILRIVRDRSEADEVLQEVFVTVWNRAETYDAAAGSPVGWLVRIARNRAIDRLRANSVRRRALESVPFERQSPEHGNPETNAWLLEQQRAVGQALDAIPREQRELIEEAYYLGLTHSELAERHHLPLGTVKTRIRTGMLTMRQQLSQVSVRQ